MAENYKQQLGEIKSLIFDIDGVFTDGIVYLMNDGEQVRTANVKDGYAIQYAVKMGYHIAIISGGRNEVVRKRFEGLGVKDIFLGSHNKMEVLNKLISEKGIELSQVCYMGDDIPDIKVLQQVGLSCCPADAVLEVQSVCDYVSHKGGGKGCVRDIVEQVLRSQDAWMTEKAHEW